MKFFHAGWMAALAMALWGCGGEDGAPSVPSDPVTITSENAEEIAATVWLGKAATSPADVYPADVRVVLDDYFPLLAYRPNTLALDVACAAAGFANITGSVADPARPGESEGDSAVALFRDCNRDPADEIGEVRNGTLTVAVTGVATENRTIGATFSGLVTAVGELGTFTQDGTLTVTLSADGSVTTARSDRFTVWGEGRTEVLENFQTRLEDEGDAFDSAFRLTFSGTQAGTEFGGSVEFETPAAFEGLGDAHPTAGELLITGAAGSSVRLVARADGTSVNVVINGEETIPTTWDALEELSL